MYPILYEKTERSFTSGGIGSLASCVSCTVTEVRNGIFECEFVYPITGPRYDDIQEGRLVAVTHDESGDLQPFEIYARSAPINGLVTFYAHHVSYWLTKAVVMPFQAISCADAMSKIEQNTITNGSFSFWTDKTTTGDMSVSQPRVVKEVLGGEEGSILDHYGKGDYKFDGFNVLLYADRGTDTDIEIRYGKNLKDITYESNEEDSYNAIVPYWVDRDTGEVMTLPEGFLKYSGLPYFETDLTDEGLDILTDENGDPLQVNTSPLVAVPFPMNDYIETKPTEAEMRTLAQALLNSSDAWAPKKNIKVDFVQLWQTEEYKDFAPLQRVNLCDRVSVYYPELGVIAVREKVVKTVYNTLLERYDEIELNQLPTTLSELTNQQINADSSGSVTADSVRSMINLAVNLIRGGLGGYIAIPADQDGLNESILVMDQPSTLEAVKVLKLDKNGLSFSGNGVNGQYSPIINISGEVVSVNGVNAVQLGSGALSVVLGGGILGQLIASTVDGEAVNGFKASGAFALMDSDGALGYRYGGSAGAGTYGAPHYFNGDVIINGNLTVTGTINGN